MKPQSLALRVLTHCNDYLVHDLPVAIQGAWETLESFIRERSLHHVRDIHMMFGGYFADEEGNCYFITLP